MVTALLAGVLAAVLDVLDTASAVVPRDVEWTHAIAEGRVDVSIVGNAKVIGGLAARTVTLSGNGFQWDERAGTLQTGSAGTYHRTAWRECPSAGPSC